MGVTANAGSDNLEAMALKTLSPAQAGKESIMVHLSLIYATKHLTTHCNGQVGSALRLCLAGPSPRAELMLARADWPGFMREASVVRLGLGA